MCNLVCKGLEIERPIMTWWLAWSLAESELDMPTINTLWYCYTRFNAMQGMGVQLGHAGKAVINFHHFLLNLQFVWLFPSARKHHFTTTLLQSRHSAIAFIRTLPLLSSFRTQAVRRGLPFIYLHPSFFAQPTLFTSLHLGMECLPLLHLSSFNLTQWPRPGSHLSLCQCVVLCLFVCSHQTLCWASSANSSYCTLLVIPPLHREHFIEILGPVNKLVHQWGPPACPAELG